MEEKVCFCGNSFVPKKKVQKFCSQSCAAKLNNHRVPKRKGLNNCSECGIPISVKDITCSIECHDIRKKRFWSEKEKQKVKEPKSSYDPKRIGDISENYVRAKFLEKDWDVFQSVGDNFRADLIIDRGNGLEKVQIKTARKLSETRIAFSTSSSYTHRGRGKRNYRGECDLFAVYSSYTQKVYLLKVDEVGLREATLNLGEVQNKKNIRYASNFEV
jgi:hypothetical protein